jgi:glycine/D-amino acid oxidase-like deaminating enzyme
VGARMLCDGPAKIEFWRMLAEEIRTYAFTRHAGTRESLEKIARDYERLADRTEERAAPSSISEPSALARKKPRLSGEDCGASAEAPNR